MKRYIVTFEQGIELARVASILNVERESIKFPDYLSQGVNEENEVTYLSNFDIAIVKLSDEQALEIARMQGVIAVEPDKEISLPEPEPETPASEITDIGGKSNILWNMQIIGADDAWMSGLSGKGVNVAIIDTGVAAHPALKIAGGCSFVAGDLVTDYEDTKGHGTHCAGIASARPWMCGENIVVGVAPGCNLYALKVFDDDITTWLSWIYSALNWCCDNNIQVASLSFGSKDTPSIGYASVISGCQSKGVTVVCATGNSYISDFPWVCSPANTAIISVFPNESSPVAVGSVDQKRNIAATSSRGVDGNPWNPVTVTAPGETILSTCLYNLYVYKSGTSMACPHVAGFAALIYEKNQGVTPMEVHEIIRQCTIKMPDTEAYGKGIINIAKLLD